MKNTSKHKDKARYNTPDEGAFNKLKWPKDQQKHI